MLVLEDAAESLDRLGHGSAGLREAIAMLQAERAAVAQLVAKWDKAYAAFKGAFDTPVTRMKMDNEYAEDARQRLYKFNDELAALAAGAVVVDEAAVSRLADFIEDRPAYICLPDDERTRIAREYLTAAIGDAR